MTRSSMFPMCFAAALALAAACDGADISDNPPAVSTIDAAPGTPDAAPGVPDAAPAPDAAPGAPDAAPGAPDAAPGTPDAAPGVPDAASAADVFCTEFGTACGFDPMDMNLFDDYDACVTAYDGFTADQRTCVESELEMVVTPGDMHCTRATGRGPCG